MFSKFSFNSGALAEEGDLVAGFGERLSLVAKKRRNLVVLNADFTRDFGLELFNSEFAARHFNMGVGVQNMLAAAVGFTVRGNMPFVVGFASDLLGKSWEQIKNLICYPNLNVKIIGVGAGVFGGQDGFSHQILEDIALMRTLPNMKVLVPADLNQTVAMVDFMANDYGPTYLRLPMGRLPAVFGPKCDFNFEEANVLRKGDDALVVVCGPLTANVLLAVDKLKEEGLSLGVVNISSLKQLESKSFVKTISKVRAVAVVEDHQLDGGVAEIVMRNVLKTNPVPVEFLGADGQFLEAAKAFDLEKKMGWDSVSLAMRLRGFLDRL